MNHNSILLVEDDGNDIILIKRAFKKAKTINPLKVVTDGEEAINYLKGEGKYTDRIQYPLPVLILLDLKLPLKSGFEVLEWLKKQEGLKRIPVVILTSSSESKDINLAYDLGANTYLVKPVHFEDLIEMLKTLGFYWMILSEKPYIESKQETQN